MIELEEIKHAKRIMQNRASIGAAARPKENRMHAALLERKEEKLQHHLQKLENIDIEERESSRRLSEKARKLKEKTLIEFYKRHKKDRDELEFYNKLVTDGLKASKSPE